MINHMNTVNDNVEISLFWQTNVMMAKVRQEAAQEVEGMLGHVQVHVQAKVQLKAVQ